MLKIIIIISFEKGLFAEIKGIYMKECIYAPKGVCAKEIKYTLDDEGRIHDLQFTGGCNGNLKAIGRLVEGQDAKAVASILKGNTCGMKGTSCADQLAQSIEKAIG